MEDGAIIELYWQRSERAIEETRVKYGAYCYQIAFNLLRNPEDAEETVSDVFEHLGFEDPEENEELVNTQMGEWAYEQFTAIPQVGESFSYHDLTVTVDEMEHNRILKLKVALSPAQEEGGEKE